MTRILHVLDHSLPMHSGYTFRTRAILRAQIELEDTFEEIARGCSPGRSSVLLIDRGTMDVLAYMGADDFQEVLPMLSEFGKESIMPRHWAPKTAQ